MALGSHRGFYLCTFYVDFEIIGGVMKNMCRCCGDEYPIGRWELGYKFCLDCGVDIAKAVAEGFTVAPLNKSNYYYIHDPKTLKELNPKRTT